MGYPALPVPWFCTKRGLQESRREHPQSQSQCSRQTRTHPESQASDSPLVRLFSSACLSSGGPVAALWLSWFLTDLASFYRSSVLLAGRTTKSGGFMCPNTHAGAVRKASFQGEEVFADRCLCLKCPCVFRPWSIGAWEHSALGTSILLSPGYVK